MSDASGRGLSNPPGGAGGRFRSSVLMGRWGGYSGFRILACKRQAPQALQALAP